MSGEVWSRRGEESLNGRPQFVKVHTPEVASRPDEWSRPQLKDAIRIQGTVGREGCGTDLIVRIGMGNANLRGISARLAESEKPSLLRAYCVPSIVPLSYM